MKKAAALPSRSLLLRSGARLSLLLACGLLGGGSSSPEWTLSAQAAVVRASSHPPLVELAATSALTAEEEASPELQVLARRFNPAMAMPIRDVWPVDVRYAWQDDAPGKANRGLYLRVEGRGAASERDVLPASALDRTDWSTLPHTTAAGEAIRYYVDAPGDDRLVKDGHSSWRQRFRELALAGKGDADPTASAFPPTQYVHAFWWNRARGLLALQYWFYYPYDEWVNHHEGDWEHVQIIVRGPSQIGAPDAAFVPFGHQYFFHTSVYEPRQLIRLGGEDPREDHPVVYVGGHGSLLGWSGPFSGGSYPMPGRYPRAGYGNSVFSPDEVVSRVARFIAAEDFKLVVLPEPERLDARKSPELSWIKLPFYAGQRTVHVNLPGYSIAGRDHPPLQPAARGSWLEAPRPPFWAGEVLPVREAPFGHDWPTSWACARPDDASTCPGAAPVASARLRRKR